MDSFCIGVNPIHSVKILVSISAVLAKWKWNLSLQFIIQNWLSLNIEIIIRFLSLFTWRLNVKAVQGPNYPQSHSFADDGSWVITTSFCCKNKKNKNKNKNKKTN